MNRLICFLLLIVSQNIYGTQTGSTPAPASQFSRANIRLEQNATDKDVEIVIEAVGTTDGLVKFTILSPDNRTIVDATSPDVTTLGMRHFNFESPEPKNINSIKAAYPEGEYRFSGITAKGIRLNSKAVLKHKLPEHASILRPESDSKDVNIKDLTIAWSEVKNIKGYVLTLEQPEQKLDLKLKIPSGTNSFIVPEGMLVSGKKYKLSVGTVSEDGNISFVETSFTTSTTSKNSN